MAYPAWKNRTIQPYNWLLSTALAGAGMEVEEFTPLAVVRRRPDVCHLHWPERLLNHPALPVGIARALAFLAVLACARLRGTRLVWTIHNLGAHDAFHPRAERLFWRAFVPLVHAHVSLSPSVERAALERFPTLRRKPGAVVPLGHYRGTYPDTVSRGEARQRLGVGHDEPVLLYLGGIRPYKNVPELVRRFRESAVGGVLLVVGSPSSEAAGAEVREAAGGDPRVRLRLDFVDADELQLYFRAADLAVFPYREVANSSSALLSLSFDCPILVPAKGAMGDLRDGIGDEWVRTYHGPLTARELEDAFRWARRSAREGRAPLDDFAWETLAARTVRLYASVAGPGRGRG